MIVLTQNIKLYTIERADILGYYQKGFEIVVQREMHKIKRLKQNREYEMKEVFQKEKKKQENRIVK